MPYDIAAPAYRCLNIVCAALILLKSIDISLVLVTSFTSLLPTERIISASNDYSMVTLCAIFIVLSAAELLWPSSVSVLQLWQTCINGITTILATAIRLLFCWPRLKHKVLVAYTLLDDASEKPPQSSLQPPESASGHHQQDTLSSTQLSTPLSQGVTTYLPNVPPHPTHSDKHDMPLQPQPTRIPQNAPQSEVQPEPVAPVVTSAVPQPAVVPVLMVPTQRSELAEVGEGEDGVAQTDHVATVRQGGASRPETSKSSAPTVVKPNVGLKPVKPVKKLKQTARRRIVDAAELERIKAVVSSPRTLDFRKTGITTVARITLAKKPGQTEQLAHYQVKDRRIHAREPNEDQARCFDFDHVFDENATNEYVNYALSPMYQTFIQVPGVNFSITCDGFSNHGKSYTTLDHDDAIIPYIAKFIFRQQPDYPDMKVAFAAIELYQEGPATEKLNAPSLNEGLHNVAQELEVKIGEAPTQARQYLVTDGTTLLELIERFKQTRTRKKTLNNKQSSRGHVLCVFTVQQAGKLPSSLFIGDLAGNERRDASLSATNPLSLEGGGINTSRESIFRNMKGFQQGAEVTCRDSKYMSCLKSCIRKHSVTGLPTAMVLISHVSLFSPYAQQGMKTLETGDELFRSGDKTVAHFMAIEDEDDEYAGQENKDTDT